MYVCVYICSQQIIPQVIQKFGKGTGIEVMRYCNMPTFIPIVSRMLFKIHTTNNSVK